MECAKCKTEMVEREGKYGKFLCCPKSNPKDNHGTVSLSSRGLPVGGVPADCLPIHIVPVGGPLWAERVGLDGAIRRQMAEFGVWMTDLDLFVEGTPDSEEEDHWMNTRLY